MTDKKTNLDDYLADLGISETEDEAPPPPPGSAALAEVGPARGAPPSDESPVQLAERFLRGLISRVDPALSLKVQEVEGHVEAEIGGEGASRLAGRDGRVLSAIELLATTVVAKQSGRADLRVRVDAGGYRRRHQENLTRLAERLAVQVAKQGEPHEMQPMSPADRRIIHITLKEHDLVTTESVGEGPARRLIIKPR